MSTFKLTYSTMFAPPREMHVNFDAAVKALREKFGEEHPFYINGAAVYRDAKVTKLDPADSSCVLGRFSLADVSDVDLAVVAARQAFDPWRRTSWQQRIEIMRKIARVVESKIYDIAAAVSFEVGKNRMEALGEVAEVVEFFDLFARQMEENSGYDRPLADDPVQGFRSANRSVFKPYGVWAVIVPFNFPFALAAGPTAAALVAGNTVVLKGATDTPWSGVLLAQCLHEAGLPHGVFNYILGDGATIGSRLVEHDGIDGVTFTGSHDVGMRVAHAQINRPFPRPCIVEMGGKNAVIVTADANLDDAAQGIVRSAYGLSGQKCSALSRIYAVSGIADELISRLQSEIGKISVGIPQAESSWMGPIATQPAYDRFAKYVAALKTQGARILIGGQQRWEASLERGLFCQPTLAEAPVEHPLWSQELFAPIAMLARVDSKERAMALVNDSVLGLTAGFYGAESDVEWFYSNVEVGVAYSNRPQGATTGAFPGYQAFGGWKGSGNTGKALASFNYLPQYMREQSQTRVTRC